MALHAVDDLSDAYRATRSFLLPVVWGRWLRLALLSVFVASSSGGGAPTGGFQGPLSTGTEPSPGGTELAPAMEQLTTALATNLWLILSVAAVGFVIAMILQWLAATFEFAFLESLRSDDVRIRQYTAAHTGPGTRLFAFRVLFGLAGLFLFGGAVLLVMWPVLTGVSPAGPLLLLVFLLPLLLVLGVVASVVYVFTTAFVAPIMLIEERTLLSAWKRFWGVFKSAWQDFLVYILVGLFLMIAIGILVGIVMAVIGIAIALPVIVLLLAAGPLAAGLLAVPAAIVGIVVWGLVQVPVQTYLRHWSLLVLGDVEPDLDLISDRRAEIRGENSS